MISFEEKPVLGPVVPEIQNWLGAGAAGETLLLCIAHQVAIHEAKALMSLANTTQASRQKDGIPLDAQRNLALAEKYRNALEVLQDFAKDQSKFVETNLPISHV